MAGIGHTDDPVVAGIPMERVPERKDISERAKGDGDKRESLAFGVYVDAGRFAPVTECSKRGRRDQISIPPPQYPLSVSPRIQSVIHIPRQRTVLMTLTSFHLQDYCIFSCAGAAGGSGCGLNPLSVPGLVSFEFD